MILFQARHTRHAVRLGQDYDSLASSAHFLLPHNHASSSSSSWSLKNTDGRDLEDSLDEDDTAEDDAFLDDDNDFEGDDNGSDVDDNKGEDGNNNNNNNNSASADSVGGEEEDDDELRETVAGGTEEQEKAQRKAIDLQAQRQGGNVGKNFAVAYQQALKRKHALQQQQTQKNSLSYHDELEQQKADIVRRQQARQERREKRAFRSHAYYHWKPPLVNVTDFSEYPVLPSDERVMPDMSGPRGGVIFFLHVPKTGGQTIRQLNARFRKHSNRKKLMHGIHPGRGRRWAGGRDPLIAARSAKDQIQNQQRRKLREVPEGGDEPIEPTLKPTFLPQRELEQLAKTKMRYVAANTLKVFQEQAIPQINDYFATANNGTKDKLLFVEVHGMDNYHALELEPYLHYWREQGKKTGTPFFSFTLLREAVSLQVSFFNFYYIHPGDPRFCINPLKPKVKCGQQSKAAMRFARRRERQQLETSMAIKDRLKAGLEVPRSEKEALALAHAEGLLRKGGNHKNGIPGVSHKRLEEVLLQVAYENPQCLFLARGERTFGDDSEQKRLRDNQLRRIECQQAYLSMQRTMDWIGRTDTLSTETLPLLTQIMFGKAELGKHLPKVNASPQKGGYVKLSDIQPSTRKALERISQLDQELYHRTIQDYTIDQWVNRTNVLSP